jgi:hypothetical protein
MKEKTWFFKGIPVLMLVFGLVLAGCGDDPSGPDPTHEILYRVPNGILTIKGDGESSVPKDGDSFTLKTSDGKEVNGTIQVAEGAITFNKDGTTNVIPPATIQSGGESIAIGAGEITFDDASTGQQEAGTGSPPTYDLYWGFIDGETYSDATAQAANQGVSLIAAGSNAGYVTGADAVAGFSKMDNNYFDNYGTLNDTFENLLNFNRDGIGLPPALKTAMTGQKANLPIAAVFEVNDPDTLQGVVVFFIQEHQ